MNINIRDGALERIIVVGAGMVGATTAYTLMLAKLAKEIILIDIQSDLAVAQALDTQHGSTGVSDCTVRAGDYSDIRDNDLVIVTAGLARLDGITRLDLLKSNLKITRSVLQSATANTSSLNVMMVANPVDLLTYFASKMPELKDSFVFGSGTFLDSKRLWTELINNGLPVSEAKKALVIGEHGDSSLSLYSQLPENYRPDAATRDQITKNVRDAAYKIIAGKQATYFGIAAAIMGIVSELVHPNGAIMPLSVIPMAGEYSLSDVAIGLPVKFTQSGLEIVSLDISAEESALLQKSAQILKEHMAGAESE